ncbi:MAG TPA: hypothetical protein VM029_14215 [Opitutaceae bacterium]|nr:hypothetical protein [Opitutaceae bacterium]
MRLPSPRRLPHGVALLLAGASLFFAPGLPAQSAAPRWFKGNLHTHTLWSDGDDYPEMVADWYKQHGYNFLALSDHNVLQEGQRWLELKAPVSMKGEVVQRGGGEVLQKYLRRFGNDWVEQREAGGKKEVRLKQLAEYRSFLEEPGRFLMIPSEEITSSWKRAKTATEPEKGGPVHINVTNPRDFIAPVAGDNALDVMQRTVNAVLAQRQKTGQPMFAHLNHPNFVWGVTAEELMELHNERFFEVYNGHPGVNNEGDATRLSMDAMWDAILTRRLAELKLDVMYGIGVDDSHHYHLQAIGKSNSGRGWVMVRARQLTPESIIHAMEAGDFYASSGVTLADVTRDGNRLAVEIKAEPGVTYVTRFIGTRKGYDPTSQIMPPPADEARKGLPHRRYSKDVGAVLAEVKGPRAAYTLKGDEIYVRAKIISSKAKENGSVAGEFETAWTQPLVAR